VTGKTISRAQNEADDTRNRGREPDWLNPAFTGRPFPAACRHANLAPSVTTGTAMKPEIRIASWLLASVFVVMGGYRLWHAFQGVPTANSTLVLSAGELLLGIAIAAGWRLRAMALLGALLMLVDAVLSHRFWTLQGNAQATQLLHFMKNIGLVGGLFLLSTVVTGKRR
jgi:putative oxidoreductase